MKLLCAEYNEAGEVAYNVIGDNALLRNNDDFYIPAFATELSCVPQIVLRIGKIGKHVAERFAERYYEEVGVGIRFTRTIWKGNCWRLHYLLRPQWLLILQRQFHP